MAYCLLGLIIKIIHLLDLRCLDTLYLTGAINLTSLIHLQYIRHLDISNNDFMWIHIPQAIGSFTNLRYLNLSFSLLSGKIPFQLGNLSLLQYPDLGRNSLLGPVPFQIGNLRQLQYLDLEGNSLSGEIPFQLRNLKRLQYLNLASNTLSGAIPFRNGNLPLLQTLRIGGKIPKSIILLSELEDLYLEGNSLEGEVTESHLSNFSKLETLSLSYNTLSLRFVSNGVPPFQATRLSLASCKLGPSFPGWLRTQNSLMSLDISDNELSDSVPAWFWNKLQNLKWLNMSHNNLNGAIPDIPLKLPYGTSIILNSNQFEGTLPPFLLQASGLLFSKNIISDLHSFLCNQIIAPNLATLDLSNNHITGQIPDCWQSLDQLLFLDLSKNKLSGNIPISMGKLVKLEALVLRKNNLRGGLHSSLKNCTNLIMLDVSENNLSGRIPSWIGESEIRKEIVHFLGIVSLNLSRNNLRGEIPSEIGNLSSLESLDLSRNHLHGRIPSSLSQLDFLGKLDLSYNSLSGRIPLGRHLQTFEASYFEGNIDLCGEQLNKSCPGDYSTAKPEAATEKEGDNSEFYEALYMHGPRILRRILGLNRANSNLETLENCLPKVLEHIDN
ncbi:receptor-like protein EIX1 [Vigna angularis]|uniref:receptor-like protein EIX1 n=1 Tax=Phaseolus angularis TaxID=3914 RepID=UPI000809C6EE|nr:receptor-like protein EIX1 [Vigna angularis]